MSKGNNRVSALVSLVACTLLMAGCPSSQTQTDAAASKDVAAETTAADVAADAAADTGGDSGTCAPMQTRCGAECVDTQTAFLHCGACRNRCQGSQRCVGGRCVRAGVCPSSCRYNRDCFLCTQEGDPANWCCGGGGGNGQMGLCTLNLTPRCPFPE